MDRAAEDHFQAFGFAVLRHLVDPAALGAELDRVMQDGLTSSFGARGSDTAGDALRFRYVPMMTARTKESLALLDRLEPFAARLLGGPVLPTRAKGVRYFGESHWHTDSERDVASIGFAAYLEPLGADSGALRVIPGSHRRELGQAIRTYGAIGRRGDELPACVVATEPGDVIAFDEHLFHASVGGAVRRQWRVDYVRDPVSPEEVAETRAYFAAIYPPNWDGGYDVERYPSYGPDWIESGRPSVARLRELGVYELAARQERP